MTDRPWVRKGVPSTGDPDTDRAVELAHQLFDQARSGDPQVLDWVDQGVPIDLTDADGNTLLMLAAYHGHDQLVAGLAARGADVDRRNDRGQSPLAGAVFKADPDVVRALLAAGADPDVGEPSARETATFFDQPELAALLEDAPAASREHADRERDPAGHDPGGDPGGDAPDGDDPTGTAPSR